MHPKNQENNYTNSFHRLVPDCRNLIFEYIFYEFTHEDLRLHANKSTPKSTISDFNFAMNYFKCHATLDEYDENVPLPKNLFSLNVCVSHLQCYPRAVPPSYFQHCNHLVELNMRDCGSCLDEMFQYMESLEILNLEEDIPYGYLSDDLFTHLKHLRQLKMIDCWQVTDRAFENLYNAGSRLEKLHMNNCFYNTDQAFSYMKGASLRELVIESCEKITGEGLKHLAGVDSLTLTRMDEFQCHEAFKGLEGTIRDLTVRHSALNSLDEKAVSHLKGISTLKLESSRCENLTDASFAHFEGSIKRLEVKYCKDIDNLSKNLLWYLSGIEHVTLLDTGIRIEAEDLPRMKDVFRNVVSIEVSPDFADASTLKELQQFIEGNGGRFACVDAKKCA